MDTAEVLRRVWSNAQKVHAIFHTYVPQPPLSDYVSLLWLHEGAAPAHAAERRLPNAQMDLVVNLNGRTING